MSQTKTILLAGGGTGGHLYPGIAVAEALKTLAPDLRCVFLCTTREIDEVILKPTGHEFIPQPIERPVRSISGLLKFWKSWRETKEVVRKVIREKTPAAVIGLGGYAAGVTVKLAAAQKIPVALINPDVIPGKANQYLMKHAAAVCCQFEATRGHVSPKHQQRLRITGCPIRADFTQLPTRAQAAQRLGLDPVKNTLTITGASQGATTINEAMPPTLAGMNLPGWQILHLSGRSNSDAVRDAYRSHNLVAQVIDFTPAMGDVWAATDLTISRAGASTCAELAVCGVPSILLPYPYHKDQHQRFNAKVLADAGTAVLLEDFKDVKKNTDSLRPVLQELLQDAVKRKTMADAAKRQGRRDAAEAVGKVVVELAGQTEPR